MKFKFLILTTLFLSLMITTPLAARSWNVISIDKVSHINPGDEVVLKVDLNRGGFEIGSFNLSIYYDPEVLTLTNAGLGDLLTACDWEYFNYSEHACEGCDYNIIKIEAVAEYYDNGHTAVCNEGPGHLATLVFNTSADTTLVCTDSPVGFYWESCMDNLFVNTQLDTLWFSDYVVDFYGNDITGTAYYGGPRKDCLSGIAEVPFRFLDYVAGGVSFKCAPTYMCGDINGDDKINLLDPVYLTAYLFKEGPAPDPIERGDVDCSETIPELNDLVYIINYIFNHGPEPCCNF
jgi:hypothetical protein